MSDSPTWEETIKEVISNELSSIAVGFPARIQKVSADGRFVDLVPMVRQPAQKLSGAWSSVELPVLSNVPYGSLQIGQFEIIVPAEVGSFVEVRVSDYDYSTWLSSGEPGNPPSNGSHELSGAMAYPFCVQPKGATDIQAGAMKIGHTGCQIILKSTTVEISGNTDSAALASMVNRIVAAIRAAAITPAADGGLSFKTGLIAALDAGDSWVTSASTKLKVGG